MAQIKIGLTTNNEQAIKELLNVSELTVDEKNKVVIPFESEMNETKTELAIKFTDSVAGVIKIDRVKPKGYSVLEIKTYTFELASGESFSTESPYDLSITSLALRLFTKALAPIKAKYAPTRTSMAAELRAKLKEEIAKYKAEKLGKKPAKKSTEVDEDAEY